MKENIPNILTAFIINAVGLGIAFITFGIEHIIHIHKKKN